MLAMPPTRQEVAVGYCRVSTASQVSIGHSLEAQQASIESYCDENNLNLLETFTEEAVSGYSLDRPQLNALRDRLHGGNIDVLVVSHLDRLTRNQLDMQMLLGELKTREVRLVTIEDQFGEQTGLDSERDTVTMEVVVAFAQWQRDRISGATKRAHDNLRAAGRAFNRDLYGFDKSGDGSLVPNEDELIILQVMQELREDGQTAAGIARQLNDAGYLGKRGGRWQSKTVISKLKHLESDGYAELYAPYIIKEPKED